MKTAFLLSFFTMLSSIFFSQDQFSYYHNIESTTFFLGDLQYEKNLKGIKFLMKDLESTDPTLYQELQEDYKLLLKKDLEAKSFLLGGTAIGIILVVAGLADDEPGFIIGGALVPVLSTSLYYRKKVGRSDLLNFTNQFNRHSKGDIIEYSFRPNINLELSVILVHMGLMLLMINLSSTTIST